MAEVRIVLDRDCPRCGWPELVAVGDSFADGPKRLECPKNCGWTARVLRRGESASGEATAKRPRRRRPAQ